jgi:integrase
MVRPVPPAWQAAAGVARNLPRHLARHGSNPCLYIRKNKGRKCERFLSDQEFRRIGEVLNRHGKNLPLHCEAISLLILTGCRKSEITCLKWSEVRGPDRAKHERIIFIEP